MAPRRAEECPMKRVAAPGCRLPSRLPPGEILTDITQKEWKLGPRLGCGGFGDIYLGKYYLLEFFFSVLFLHFTVFNGSFLLLLVC